MFTPRSQSVESSIVFHQTAQIFEAPPHFEEYKKSNLITDRIMNDYQFAIRCQDFPSANPAKSAQEDLESRYRQIQKETKAIFESRLAHPVRIPVKAWQACHQSDTLLGLAEIGLQYVTKLASEADEGLYPRERLFDTVTPPLLRRSNRIKNQNATKKTNPPKMIRSQGQKQKQKQKRVKEHRPDTLDRPHRKAKARFRDYDSATLRSILRPGYI